MATTATQRTNDFDRLIRLNTEFDQLIERVGKLRKSIQTARLYLANPESNPGLGHAYLNLIIPRYRATLARLNRTRQEALDLLVGTDCPENSLTA